MSIVQCCCIILLAPLFGALAAGFLRKPLGRVGAHSVTIFGVLLAFVFSIYVAYAILSGNSPQLDIVLYSWASGQDVFPYAFNIGLLVDPLSVIMLVIVTFVSLLVHIYSIGYMADDDGYQRFFSYISLFTFMMLTLVIANNFLQLFFGWEGVGLVSYLLIGFWYHKESAIAGSLKAFIVNRVGDFGFVLGMALILMYAGSLDYAAVFNAAPQIATEKIVLFTGHAWSVITVTCILLFIGAMGKSAQVPLHVWLPESMEGPTPISALIHAATMVTAGVFMVARISPLIELSPTALTLVLMIGATGALFTGILALVMNDIKRVIAYSTLSQLGYMMAAMGASAYSAGIFHLLTHACFKALLFLSAGSVILGMHHEQDMRKMGGLWRKMPVTYITFLIGSLALCAIPPFAGFYSKDTIIEAVLALNGPGHLYAAICVVLGAMITALYTFRALFMTFHGKPRMDKHTWEHVHESPWVVYLPLILLAIPSAVIGYVLYMPLLFNTPSLWGDSLFVLPTHNVLATIGHEVISPWVSMRDAPFSLVFWLTLFGVFLAWIAYSVKPTLPAQLVARGPWIYRILVDKYGLDRFNDFILVRGSKKLGTWFDSIVDHWLIDGLCVNGVANTMQNIALRLRVLQSGYLYHYVGFMLFGILVFLAWLLL